MKQGSSSAHDVLLKELVDFVETMIVQHDYPGFEARALNLGLPMAITKSSAKLFAQALEHDNIYVQLAALRWFQEHSGVARTQTVRVAKLLEHPDLWVRLEAVKVLERAGEHSVAEAISLRLQDSSELVRKQAAKACGKLLAKQGNPDRSIVSRLQQAAEDSDQQVRSKAQKALRKIGAYQ